MTDTDCPEADSLSKRLLTRVRAWFAARRLRRTPLPTLPEREPTVDLGPKRIARIHPERRP